MWNLYLLYHKASNRTYIGITTNVQRRLRQHRGEIVGGARFTARIAKAFPEDTWKIVAFISGFENRSCATRWERLLKLKTRGQKQRLEALEALAKGKHPKEFSDPMRAKYEVPKNLVIIIG